MSALSYNRVRVCGLDRFAAQSGLESTLYTCQADEYRGLICWLRLGGRLAALLALLAAKRAARSLGFGHRLS